MIFYEDDLEKYQIVPGIRLKQAQLEAIDFALHKFNCIFNLSTGYGKTILSIIASYKIMSKTSDTVTFIICPKQANTAFKKELKRMGLKFSICVTGERSIVKNSRYFIFNYSNPDEMITLLTKLRDRGYRVIGIFDEVHKLGNPESGISKKMYSVRNQFSAVWGVSATPLLNDFKGLWAVCNFVRPKELGTWYDFKSRWLITKKRTIRVRGGKSRQIEELVGYKDLDMLRDILKNFIITRSYPYNVKFYYKDCSLTEEELSIYELASKGILDEVKQEDYAPRLWNLQRVADGCDDRSQQLGISSKQKLLLSTIKEVLSRDEGALIYTELEDTYQLLGNIIENYRGYLGYHKLWYITGKINYAERVRCEKNLQPKDLVVFTKAGSASLNLQAVNNVIFYDIPFSSGDTLQAAGRVARVDSKYDHQNIYFLEAKDTIDSYKRMLMQGNMQVISDVFTKTSTMPEYHDNSKDALMKYRNYLKMHCLWKRF